MALKPEQIEELAAALRANPTAQRCIACKGIYEKTHAQPGRATP